MDQSINRFLNFMFTEKGSSPNTVLAYSNDLHQFEEYLKTTQPGSAEERIWGQIEGWMIVDYVLTLRRRNYAETTIARKVASIKSFFQYMQAEGKILNNPAETIESPRIDRSVPRPLTLRQVDDLLNETLKD